MSASAVFASGARSSEEQPRYDLIPVSALKREAQRMGKGARDHGENNYQKGKDDPAFIRDRINHLINHALMYASGDRSDDHLAAVRANAGMLIWVESVQESRVFINNEPASEMNDIAPQPVGQLGWVIPEAEKMHA